MKNPTRGATAPVNPEPSPAALVKFSFHGDELDVARLADGDVGVSLRRLCEAVPVDFSAQTRRLAREATNGARWATVVKMATVAEDGKPREMLVLPRRSIPMFAATISLGSVREDLRPGIAAKLARYQDECADALADHFLGKRTDSAPPTALLTRLTATLEALHARVESLESRPVPSLDRPSLGAGAARIHVLNPLREIAAIEARAAKREGDKRALASLRLLAESDLRARLGFLRNGGQSWDRFPLARLGELHCALGSLFHAARRRADILTPTATQLRLIKQA